MKCVLERKHMPLMLIIGLFLVFSGVLMDVLSARMPIRFRASPASSPVSVLRSPLLPQPS